MRVGSEGDRVPGGNLDLAHIQTFHKLVGHGWTPRKWAKLKDV